MPLIEDFNWQIGQVGEVLDKMLIEGDDYEREGKKNSKRRNTRLFIKWYGDDMVISTHFSWVFKFCFSSHDSLL